MKNSRFILIVSLIILLTGCARAYKQASYVSSRAYLGMSLAEFKSIARKKATLESMEGGYTVYKISDYDPLTSDVDDTKYYYFDTNQKLVKIK